MKRKKRTITKPHVVTPRMEWQQGEYSRKQELSFIFPYEFLLCCKLMDIPPRTMLLSFMNMLSFNTARFEEPAEAKLLFIKFLAARTGEYMRDQLQEIDTMLQELHSIAMLHPAEGDTALLDAHERWKDVYLPYWFNKWSKKIRVPEKSVNSPR